jgi:hypothetical protein
MEQLKCPECPDEVLIRRLGNVLVCASCDLQFIERSKVNNPLGDEVVLVLPGDENGRDN